MSECFLPTYYFLMKITEMTDLRELERLLDESQVAFMLYDSQQDIDWIQTFRNNPSWDIDSEDDETVLFSRNNRIFTKR